MFDAFILNAISNGDTDFDYVTCENAQRLLTRFNREIASIVDQHGLKAIGTAIWYLYGCVSCTTHDVLDESVQSGYSEFYRSLESLYENGFAKHCENRVGHSDRGGKFATACYMIWDMDSGLEYHSFKGPPVPFDYVSNLIDFGLQHYHAAVQESFLHCLGHRRDAMPDFVDPMLAKFLRRHDISPEIREYAKQCKTGMIL
jgi:hypothetical protein